MSRFVGWSVRRVALLALTLLPPAALDAQQAADWDVMTPRGKTRVIDFAVDEGTWMSVDLARDGQWLVFDLLGHIYRLPIAGGEAENLTANSGIALNFHPRISPDGRFIAYNTPAEGQPNSDIFLLAINGGSDGAAVAFSGGTRRMAIEFGPGARSDELADPATETMVLQIEHQVITLCEQPRHLPGGAQ